MTPQIIADLLERVIGLDAARVLPDVLEATVRTRMQHTGITDLSAYTSRLSLSSEELQALVEEAAVPESSFFREATTLESLTEWAVDSANRPKGRKLKILSAGCAAGEEAYTMAMLLLRKGMRPAGVEIVGGDVRRQAVDAARRGEYSRRSLRGKPVPEYLTTTSEETLLVAPVLREVVQFEPGNVLTPELLAGRRPFDIVLCRNLLFYMNTASQEKVFRNTKHLIAERGLFAVAAAEAPLLASAGFARLSSSLAAVFTRKNVEPSATPERAAEAHRPSLPRHAAVAMVSVMQPRMETPASSFTTSEESSSQTSHAHPRRPADAPDDCWNHIGVWAVDRPSCPLLSELHHCVNCPFYLESGRSLLDAPAPPEYLAEWSASLIREKEIESADTLAVAVFRLGEEWLALPAGALAEVAEFGSVRTLPHVSSQLLLGVVTIRGELHLCISLSNLLNVSGSGTKTEPERRATPGMVVMSMNGDRWVFPADEVAATVRVRPESLRDLPVTLVKDKSAYTVGLFQWEDQSVGLLDETLLFQALRRGVSTE